MTGQHQRPVPPGARAIRRQLGKHLQAARTLAGLSQRELDKSLPVSQSVVSRAEAGAVALPNNVVIAWLTACGAADRQDELLTLNRLAHEAAAGAGTARTFTLIDGDEPSVRVGTLTAELLITEHTLIEKYRALFDMLTGAALTDRGTTTSTP